MTVYPPRRANLLMVEADSIRSKFNAQAAAIRNMRSGGGGGGGAAAAGAGGGGSGLPGTPRAGSLEGVLARAD